MKHFSHCVIPPLSIFSSLLICNKLFKISIRLLNIIIQKTEDAIRKSTDASIKGNTLSYQISNFEAQRYKVSFLLTSQQKYG